MIRINGQQVPAARTDRLPDRMAGEMHHFLCIQHFGLAAELCFEFLLSSRGVPCHHNQNRAVIRQLKKRVFCRSLTGGHHELLLPGVTVAVGCVVSIIVTSGGMRAEPGTNRFDTHSGLRFIIMCFFMCFANSSP